MGTSSRCSPQPDSVIASDPLGTQHILPYADLIGKPRPPIVHDLRTGKGRGISDGAWSGEPNRHRAGTYPFTICTTSNSSSRIEIRVGAILNV